MTFKIIVEFNQKRVEIQSDSVWLDLRVQEGLGDQIVVFVRDELAVIEQHGDDKLKKIQDDNFRRYKNDKN